ncbi:WD repeat domain phosphoinositide-interacting protein 4 [Aplysia californica]|uniref:WD repeat domain phosphoinositide-interacting protein 4 n=1 Tax=Aplysia californica TaxID=6500 RepID=A0ABM1A9Q5_APLCA|nr:WD repeat domain phosphoinositide-interacting protein 4 [Aplysia californica]
MARQVMNVKLNQDQEYFICATDDGLRIFHMDPLVQITHVGEAKIGSVRCVEMRFRSNIVAFVSGGARPLFDDRTVVLWDLLKERPLSKVVLKEPVLSIKMINDRLLVILRSRIIVLRVPRGETLTEFTTRDNPGGVCAVSCTARKMVFPSSKNRGCVQIEDLDRCDTSPESTPPLMVQAHGNDIVCVAINAAGDSIATASTQGTNIHVYNTLTKETTKLRRGVDKANIYCLNFSKDTNFLCCSSDKGTVHVWSLKDIDLNPVSVIKPLVGLPVEVKSYASFTVTAECACVCSVGSGDAIYAVCLDGSFQKYKLGRDGSQTETGRNCFRVSYDVYPNVGELYD